MAFIRPRHLKQLSDNDWVAVENFLPQELGQSLLSDLKTLRSQKNRFVVASIGTDGQIQDKNTPFRDIRRSETCFLGRQCKDLGSTPPAREQMYGVLDDLLDDLNTTASVPLDKELIEVMYAYYPNGGYYRRHRDAEAGTMSSIRQYSFLIYLNENWKENDGGCLRIHRDGGGDYLPPGALPNYIDIMPKMGTLIIFKSDKIPHEVLDTNAERCAIVGWFLSSTGPNTSDLNGNEIIPQQSPSIPTKKDGIDEETLNSLRKLKDAVPSISQKLKPAPPVSQSGMIGFEDFNFPGFGTETKTESANLPSFPDTDPLHWQKICTFDESGKITTLSLGSMRLHRVAREVMLQPSLLNATTLDLASTDLPLPILCDVLGECPRVKQIHLGGNALGDNGVIALCQTPVLRHCRTIDLRYNDIGADGAEALGRLLKMEDCCIEVLFLEGNMLGDVGVKAFEETHSLLELYLGQNNIGKAGAESLAHGLETGRLKKLYLEGNCIGPEGADSFRIVLERLGDEKHLEKLYVDNNGIGKDHAQALAKAVNSATVIGDGGLFQ